MTSADVLGQLDAPAVTAALRRHVAARVSEAGIEQFPFPHIIVENIFPDEIYRLVLELNPFRQNPGAEWLSREHSATVTARTPYHARKQIELRHDGDYGSARSNVLWRGIAGCFFNEDCWFERLVYGKYADYFAIRFGEIVREPAFFTLLRKQLFLQRHEPGFVIGPHTDLPARVFTCIFSFADREGFESYGTQLLSHKDPLVRCWGNDHYDSEDFAVRKVAPYSPNNFLLFFKTRQSFHSVKAIDGTVPNQRYGMQFQLLEPAAGLFRDLSKPDLMHFPKAGRAH